MADYCSNYVNFYGNAQSKARIMHTLASMKGVPLNDINTGVEYHLDLDGESFLGWVSVKDGEIPENTHLADFFGSKWYEGTILIESNGRVVFCGSSAYVPPFEFYRLFSRTFGLTGNGDFEECAGSYAGYIKFPEPGVIDIQEVDYYEWIAKENPDSYWDYIVDIVSDGEFDSIEQVEERMKRDGYNFCESDLEYLERRLTEG